MKDVVTMTLISGFLRGVETPLEIGVSILVAKKLMWQ